MSATEPRDALASLLLEFRAEVTDTCARAEGFAGGWRDCDWTLEPVDLEAWSERFLRARPTASEEAIEAAVEDLRAAAYANYRLSGTAFPNTEPDFTNILRRHFGASDTGGEHGH